MNNIKALSRAFAFRFLVETLLIMSELEIPQSSRKLVVDFNNLFQAMPNASTPRRAIAAMAFGKCRFQALKRAHCIL